MPQGRVLIVDDEEVIASTLKEFLQGEGFEVATARDLPSALAQVEALEPEIVLCDVQLPGADGITVLNRVLQVRPETLFIMITAYATVENAVAAFQRGAHDYLMKPVLFEDLLAKIGRLVRFRRLLQENQALRRELHAKGDIDALVGESPPMQAVKTLIRKVGPTRTTVLITGESGTGKELVARALHALGPASDEMFLAINCAAIPHDLLENQLFGHVRGAFTGADRDHAGLFVAAGRGTVFLDEIGELARSTQAKLLRAIENKEVLPVGATHPVSFQARLLTATNKDLAAEVAADRFRADLYYRLERGVDPPASAAQPPRGYSRPGLRVAGEARQEPGQASRRRRQRDDPGLDVGALDRQRARARQRPGARLDLERRTDPDAGRFPAGPDRRIRRRRRRRQPARGGSRVRAPSHSKGLARMRRRQARGRPPARAGACRRFIGSSRNWRTEDRYSTRGRSIAPRINLSILRPAGMTTSRDGETTGPAVSAGFSVRLCH